ncbi:hypothetical protein STEG23_015381 [Scotinomys teguina]
MKEEDEEEDEGGEEEEGEEEDEDEEDDDETVHSPGPLTHVLSTSDSSSRFVSSTVHKHAEHQTNEMKQGDRQGTGVSTGLENKQMLDIPMVTVRMTGRVAYYKDRDNAYQMIASHTRHSNGECNWKLLRRSHA